MDAEIKDEFKSDGWNMPESTWLDILSFRDYTGQTVKPLKVDEVVNIRKMSLAAIPADAGTQPY
jgi:hypothetical protein